VKRLMTLGSIAVLAGCHAERITSADLPITSAAADAWSGGTIVLRSASFTGADSLPTVMVGADTLVVQSLGAESVLVHLPDTSGPITLAVKLREIGRAHV
jgi:hypothetical protein